MEGRKEWEEERREKKEIEIVYKYSRIRRKKKQAKV
jgi:hypothetical protein